MSRSRRKNPFCGVTKAESDKKFKQLEHRRERANVSTQVRSFNIEDEDVDIAVNDEKFGNRWSSPKDGRIRFNPDKYPKWMRK